LLLNAHNTAPEMSNKAKADPPARTFRESRVIFGRSAVKRRVCAPVSDEGAGPDAGSRLSFVPLSVTIASRRF
jgi:hypothetical protein